MWALATANNTELAGAQGSGFERRHGDGQREACEAILTQHMEGPARESVMELFEGSYPALLTALQQRFSAAATTNRPTSVDKASVESTHGVLWLFGSPIYLADVDGLSGGNCEVASLVRETYRNLYNTHGWANREGPTDTKYEFFHWQ